MHRDVRDVLSLLLFLWKDWKLLSGFISVGLIHLPEDLIKMNLRKEVKSGLREWFIGMEDLVCKFSL